MGAELAKLFHSEVFLNLCHLIIMFIRFSLRLHNGETGRAEWRQRAGEGGGWFLQYTIGH